MLPSLAPCPSPNLLSSGCIYKSCSKSLFSSFCSDLAVNPAFQPCLVALVHAFLCCTCMEDMHCIFAGHTSSVLITGWEVCLLHLPITPLVHAVSSYRGWKPLFCIFLFLWKHHRDKRKEKILQVWWETQVWLWSLPEEEECTTIFSLSKRWCVNIGRYLQFYLHYLSSPSRSVR